MGIYGAKDKPIAAFELLPYRVSTKKGLDEITLRPFI